MPVYEYKCEQTANVYEVEQKINDKAFTKCVMPNCQCNGESPTHRIISKNVGVIFNGSGFYQTDYVRKKSTGNEANNSSKPTACCSCSDNTCPHAH